MDYSTCNVALGLASQIVIGFKEGFAEQIVNNKIVGDTKGFAHKFTELLHESIPGNWTEEAGLRQLLYIRDRKNRDVILVKFKRYGENTYVVESALPTLPHDENAFYESYGVFHGFRTTHLPRRKGQAFAIDDQRFYQVQIPPAIRAKLWLKHGMDLEKAIRIIDKTKYAIPTGDAHSRFFVARTYLDRTPYQPYFHIQGRKLILGTIYQSGPKQIRLRKPRDLPAPGRDLI